MSIVKGVGLVMLALKSRNHVIIFAIVFLLVIVTVKFAVGVISGSIVSGISTLMASNTGKAILKTSIPKIDFNKFIPRNWDVDGMLTKINKSAHNMIDVIFPSFVNSMSIFYTQSIILIKSTSVYLGVELYELMPIY